MKEVVITNRVVGRGSTGTSSPASSVNLSAYALKSDLLSLEKSFNDFIQEEDTDTVINRWKELEAFLNGIGEELNLLLLLSDKADRTYVDSNFVTINTAQSILGEKNFTGGLQVNGSPIVYNSEEGYWKLEGDLLVTGGISFYSNDTAFVPSTIMDALLLDDSTLGINSDGQLYVKGNLSGGASTLGELSNVGTWADSVASQDRIMYQAANSSQWVAKSLSDLAVGGVTGDYLPLSGGTITNSTVGIIINRTSDSTPWIGFQRQGVDIGRFGMDEHIPLWYDALNYTSYSILHSGNYSSYALPLTGGELSNTLTIKNSGGGLKIIRTTSESVPYISFGVNDSNMYGDIGVHYSSGYPVFWNSIAGSTSWKKIWCEGNDGSGSGLDADLLDGYQPSDLNVGSATKLQTARTIWGQSFDGTGNISGTAHIGQQTNGTATIDAFGGVAYFGGDAVQDGAITSTTGAYIAIKGATGNVGIGTASPSAKLHVAGDVYANAAISTASSISAASHIYSKGYGYFGLYIFVNRDAEGIYLSNNVISWHNSSNSFSKGLLKFDSSGYVTAVNGLTVGASSSNNATYKLHVTGSAYISSNLLTGGGITMYSQRNLKNIQDERGLSLNELSIIKPTRYTWKDNRDDRIHIGGIADDIQQVLPEVVYKTSDNVLTLDYGNAAFAIASSLIKPVIDHEKRISMLEQENEQLREELKRLKSA